ncbi:MAG: hypothetical protein ACI9MR_001828 [Myxococcota bacterium]
MKRYQPSGRTNPIVFVCAGLVAGLLAGVGWVYPWLLSVSPVTDFAPLGTIAIAMAVGVMMAARVMMRTGKCRNLVLGVLLGRWSVA